MPDEERPARGTLRKRADAAVPKARGFTLVEMLIVIAVIIILMSILVVGLNAAKKAGQRANTEALMNSLKQALVRFKDDIGYYPPILDMERRLVEGPRLDRADYREFAQTWSSTTSLAEYLIGYGHGKQDGYGYVPPPEGPLFEEEVPATGIRHPGPDGVWGAGANSAMTFRNPVNTGRVYGPYLELGNARLLGQVKLDYSGAVKVILPGEQDYDETAPKAILDYWGRPIEYFRRNYPPGALAQSYRAVDNDGDGVPDPVPTLSDVYRLRPFEIAPGADTRTRFPDLSPLADRVSTYALETAEFALFSPGPDRAFNGDVRYDVSIGAEIEELNRDNIVELGP